MCIRDRDLRSGLERLTYSIIIVLVATMFAWIMALLLKLQPQDFVALHLGNMMHLALRLIASFCGVFGFSIMFNSSVYMLSLIHICSKKYPQGLQFLDVFEYISTHFEWQVRQ